MPSTINYKPGDVVLIPFPFTDFSTLKQRPAIVLSSPSFNKAHRDIIVAAITSQVAGGQTSDTHLLNKREQESCGLLKPSVIRLGKIVTLDQRLIRKRLGRLPKKSMGQVASKIGTILSGT
jgi:mRNA interferase MazF